MDTKVNYALVGTFVIFLLSAIILSILWLSSGLNVQNYDIYQVNMDEAVTGLSIDAIVEYNGVNVGAVKKIALRKDDPQSVELLLKIRRDTPVTYGTVATLATRGLTGITYIALKDKGTDLRPLKKGPGQDYPVIKTTPSLLLQLNVGLQKLTESLGQVSTTFKNLFDQENLQAIKEIVINMREVTSNLAANNAKLNTILTNTSLASQRLPALIQSSQQTLQAFESQTLPETNHIVANLNTITDNLTGLSVELRDNPSLLIRGKQPRVPGPGEK
ncbi:MAG TPA: MlaD family protein [Gammaproteobacteria bacterium]|nr:MlaD family protein [Gammaproteobacteria bacterium]